MFGKTSSTRQTTGTLTLLSEYTGFGKIRNVLYRER